MFFTKETAKLDDNAIAVIKISAVFVKDKVET